MDNRFTPLEQGAWGALLGMYGRLLRLIDADLLEHAHISHIEFEVLLRLSWAEGQRARIQDIAAQSVLTRSGISRVVERLASIGLVRREQADEDRRGAYAILTEAGAQRLNHALDHHVAFVRQNFLRYFSEDELRQMGVFWKRVDPLTRQTDEAE